MIDILKFIGILIACVVVCILLIVPISLIFLAMVLETVAGWIKLGSHKLVELLTKFGYMLMSLLDKKEEKKSEEEIA